MNKIIGNFRGFNGRLNRQPFWISAIILAVISVVISLVILPLIGLSLMPAMPALDGTATPADVANIINTAHTRSGWVSLILFLVFLYPGAAISIKRRHDRNNNGYDAMGLIAVSILWNLLTALGVVSAVGGIGQAVSVIIGIYAIYILVVVGFLKGTAGANNYGPDPLQG